MPRLPLLVSEEEGFASLTALIAFRGVAGPPQGGTISLYLDTGATRTIIGEQDKGLIEDFRPQLKRSPEPLAGWGGSAEAYIIPEPNLIVVRDEENEGHTFNLGDLIYGEVQIKKKRRAKRYNLQPIPSVLGADFLMKQGAKVYIDYASLEGYIEVP